MPKDANHAAPQYPGDPRHPEHREYLYELGAAVYAARRLDLAAFDLLRVHEGVRSAELYDDTLGRLLNRLRDAQAQGAALPDLDVFLGELDRAREARNDLMHALPVQNGLYRRRRNDPGCIVEFFTLESLRDVRSLFDAVARKGNGLLYFDGGRAVKAWLKLPPSQV